MVRATRARTTQREPWAEALHGKNLKPQKNINEIKSINKKKNIAHYNNFTNKIKTNIMCKEILIDG